MSDVVAQEIHVVVEREGLPAAVVTEVEEGPVTIVTEAEQGPPGPQGPAGPPGPIGDAGGALLVTNRLSELATDPQAQADAQANLGLGTSDPLAYYILAKA